MQNILLSSEGGPWPPKNTVTIILGEHQAAATTILGPALSLLRFRDNHPGQFFPLLTHNITCSFLCTPCSLFKGLRFFCGAREEVWRTQSLFFRHNSRLIPSGVTWVSWRVWHGCEHSTHILKLPLTLHGGIHVPASKAVVSGLALFSFDTQKCLPRWKNPPYKSSRALPCW